nr:hypothetical protein [Tanacetum cinerariifolium]
MPMNSKLESERLKRPGIQLDIERIKKLKTAEASGIEPTQKQQSKEPKELSEEEIKKMIDKGALEELKRIYEPDSRDPLWAFQRWSIKFRGGLLGIKCSKVFPLLGFSVIIARIWACIKGMSETKTDASYHKEKMLLCKQEEARIQLNEEQADWKDDTDDESKDQELEAHYMYIAQIQEVTPDTADNSGPISDVEPLQKVQNDDDNYNVFDDDQDDTDELA